MGWEEREHPRHPDGRFRDKHGGMWDVLRLAPGEVRPGDVVVTDRERKVHLIGSVQVGVHRRGYYSYYGPGGEPLMIGGDPGRVREVHRPAPSEGTADWSRLVSERLGAPGGHVDRVEGRDLPGELSEADWAGLAGQAPSLYEVASGTAPDGDRALGAIWQRQGFDGPPRVVDEQTLQQAIDSGAMSLWRAVNEVDLGLTTYRSAEQIAELYRTGTARPGLGGAGNGTYFAPDRAKDNMSHYGDAVIHAALNPDARTISLADLQDLMAADGITHELLFGDESRWTHRQRVLADAGRYAALRGYDAILHWWSARDKEQPHEIIVLNRTALMVAEAAGG